MGGVFFIECFRDGDPVIFFNTFLPPLLYRPGSGIVPRTFLFSLLLHRPRYGIAPRPTSPYYAILLGSERDHIQIDL